MFSHGLRRGKGWTPKFSGGDSLELAHTRVSPLDNTAPYPGLGRYSHSAIVP